MVFPTFHLPFVYKGFARFRHFFNTSHFMRKAIYYLSTDLKRMIANQEEMTAYLIEMPAELKTKAADLKEKSADLIKISTDLI